MPRASRLLLAGGLAFAVGAGLAGVAVAQRDDPPPSTAAQGTPAGDACAQVVSAITAADGLLVDLGLEQEQDFSAAVRGRLSEVAATVRAEDGDWPDEKVQNSAAHVGELAHTASREVQGEEALRLRARSLLAYRAASAQLVLLCQDKSRLPEEPQED